MTNNKPGGANLVVVDGSNIATEGRSVPSLVQLNEAVLSLTHEFPDITVTVVVDATFGHRIDKSEVAEFDEAVAHNELVTPPAGAIGRGDAFVLSIANKVGARIFSNDSFQEFHGVYPWLFDEGRLIGGKPVPHVGWVFVNRVPVKGPLSRKARTVGKDGGASRRPASELASLPMPVPTSPPPSRAAKAAAAPDAAPARGRRRKSDESAVAEPVPATGRDAAPPATAAVPLSGGPVNDLLPFLDFVEHHPVGSSVSGTVASYSSHGAYVTIGEVRGYVPLRLMSSPPPRSAREVMRMGEMVTLVVASFAPARRSVDLAVPGVGSIAMPDVTVPATKRNAKKVAATAPIEEPAAPSRRGRKKAAADAVPTEAATPPEPAGRKAAPVKQAAPAKAAAKKSDAAKKSGAAKNSGAAKRSGAAKTETVGPAAASAKRSRAKKASAAEPQPPLVPDVAAAPAKQPASKRGSKKAAPTAVAATVESAPETTPRQASRRRRAQPTRAE